MRVAAALLSASLLLAASAGAARLVGTDASDRLVGTPRADTLLGLGGADRLFGLAGDDVLVGGAGRDVLDGGSGRDRLAAQYDGARDTVRCGPGRDLVNADLLDRVAADCELVGRRLSRDPYTGPEARHETEVEPDSLTVGQTTVATFQVGRRANGGADNLGFAVSRDGGRTWTGGLLPSLTRVSRPPGPHDRASDPVVAFDAATGTWLIAALALEGRTTRLTVSRSSDGLSWSAPVVAAEAGTVDGGIAFDKEWLVCDNGEASPYRGRCYLVYTDTARRDALGAVASDDGGVTWSAPVNVSGADAVGAFPVVRPSGELVVPFLWGGNRIGASTSRDGGVSFEPPVVISDLRVRSPRGLRFFPLPAADVETSGRVWVTWHDCRSSQGCGANSIVVATSADGSAWSAPTPVTGGRNALLPAIGIHPGTGRAALAYHVVGPAGGIDVELLELGPSGRPLGAPRRLSAQTMRPEWLPETTAGRMLADYISVHYAGERPLVLWALASEPVAGELRQAIYATLG